MVSALIADSHTTTSACCTACDWTGPEQLQLALSVRIVARQHAEQTTHTVAILTTTVVTLSSGDADKASPEVRTTTRAAS